MKLILILSILISSSFFSIDTYAQRGEEFSRLLKKYRAECKKDNYKSCYKLGGLYESRRANKRALALYKRICSTNNPKGIDSACEKLEGGSEEVFIFDGFDAATRRNGNRFAKECREKSFSGCWNLGLIYLKKEKTEQADKLIKRACQGGVESACYYLEGDQSSIILNYSSAILFGICVFILAFSFLSGEEEFKTTESMEEGADKTVDYKQFGIVFQYSRPFFKRYLSPIVAGMKGKKKIREKYKRTLASGGLSEVMTPEDFYAFKLFLILGFPFIFIAVRAFLEETWPLKLIPFLAAFGYIYPDTWASGRADMRRKDVIMNMPFSVDMLALSVEAGLDFVAAISKVTEKAKPSALTDEFNIMLKEIKVGSSRAESLRNMAWRIDLIQISSFCATLIAADSVGANIGPILKNLSIEIRQKKTAEAEKAGATAATKILFPMLFLIVPAVFITVAAPLALEMIVGRK